MNGKTHAYLDLAALPAVGKVLLDGRPAFVFRADGTRILWANAAGAAFFGETSMGTLLDRQLSPLNPLTRQIARLARLLPAEPPRIEILRFGFGVRLATLPAACRRLNLADGTTAVLALAALSAPVESVVARAERLADTIGAHDCLAAVLARDGRVLGASGGFADLAAASDEIDTLIEAATEARIVKRLILVEGRERPAGVARVEAGEGPVYLLIVGPEEAVRASAAAPPAPVAEPTSTPVAVPQAVPAPARCPPAYSRPRRPRRSRLRCASSGRPTSTSASPLSRRSLPRRSERPMPASSAGHGAKSRRPSASILRRMSRRRSPPVPAGAELPSPGRFKPPPNGSVSPFPLSRS